MKRAERRTPTASVAARDHRRWYTDGGTWPLLALAFAGVPVTRAVARSGEADRPLTAADTEDARADAARRLQSAEAAVVVARQDAVRAYRASAAFTADATALDAAFTAYADKRNAILAAVEQRDPRYGTLERGVADAEAEIARAGLNPAVTPEGFGDLLNQRAGFLKQVRTLEDDAVSRDLDVRRLRQRWMDAAEQFDTLCDKQADAVAGSDKVKQSLATLADARAAVERFTQGEIATGAPVDSGDGPSSADTLCRRFPHFALGWSDAWLTDGPPTAGAAAATMPSAGAR